MFANSAVILALVAAAAPALSAPLPAAELDARLSLPAGAVGDLIKSLGKGILSGGAVSGLLALLDGGSSDSSSTPAARALALDEALEARGGLASVLEKLVGAGAESLESVLKNAVLGGVASGVAVEGVNAVAGQTKREYKRGAAAAVVDDAAKVAEKGLASILGNGAASGVGSALGGLGIGAIISKLFGSSSSSTTTSRRALADLSDEEVNSLLEWINEQNGGSNVASRAVALGSVGKGIAGLIAGLAATQGVESAIDEVKSLLRREVVSWDELD